jgi:hypothetical protein
MDVILGWLMFAGVAVVAGVVFFLLGRHHHRTRKARKLAKQSAKPHNPHTPHS